MLANMKQKRGTKKIEIVGEIRNYGTAEEPQRNDLYFSCSTILSKLITEAGKACKSYSSDLFISWESMINDIQKCDNDAEMTYYFGFRELGVDHKDYIETRLECPECYGEKPYKSIFRLHIKMMGDSVKMTLTQLL